MDARIDALLDAFARAREPRPDDLGSCLQSLPDASTLPSPWETWVLIGLVRHRESLEKLKAEFPEAAPLTLLVADHSTPGAISDTLREAHTPPDSVAIAILCAAIKHDGRSVLSLPELRETFQVNFFSAVELAGWLCGSADSALQIPSGQLGVKESPSSAMPAHPGYVRPPRQELERP